MYYPEKFKNTDQKYTLQIISKFPFATVVTTYNNDSWISHLPIAVDKINSNLSLIGHMAKANPHWQKMHLGSTTVIFHGHHTYITPKWYANNDVPTWNYSVVHAKGKIEVLKTHDELLYCLKVLTHHTETLWPSGWEFFIPEDLSHGILEKSIVGFKIDVTDLVCKAKLSQNRSDQDRLGVLQGLQTRGDEQSLGVLEDMKRILIPKDT